MIASLVNDELLSGSIRTCAVVMSNALRWRSSDKLSKVAVLVVLRLFHMHLPKGIHLEYHLKMEIHHIIILNQAVQRLGLE